MLKQQVSEQQRKPTVKCFFTCAGRLEDGTVFDSTLGGLKYRDGGPGVFRPVVIRLSGYPQPGICLGLQQGIEGMKIGGQRTVKFGPALGFGDKPALAPYSIIPSGSTVQYDIELLRVSSVGPDLLMKVCGCQGHHLSAQPSSRLAKQVTSVSPPPAACPQCQGHERTHRNIGLLAAHAAPHNSQY